MRRTSTSSKILAAQVIRHTLDSSDRHLLKDGAGGECACHNATLRDSGEADQLLAQGLSSTLLCFAARHSLALPPQTYKTDVPQEK